MNPFTINIRPQSGPFSQPDTSISHLSFPAASNGDTEPSSPEPEGITDVQVLQNLNPITPADRSRSSLLKWGSRLELEGIRLRQIAEKLISLRDSATKSLDILQNEFQLFKKSTNGVLRQNSECLKQIKLSVVQSDGLSSSNQVPKRSSNMATKSDIMSLKKAIGELRESITSLEEQMSRQRNMPFTMDELNLKLERIEAHVQILRNPEVPSPDVDRFPSMFSSGRNIIDEKLGLEIELNERVTNEAPSLMVTLQYNKRGSLATRSTLNMQNISMTNIVYSEDGIMVKRPKLQATPVTTAVNPLGPTNPLTPITQTNTMTTPKTKPPIRESLLLSHFNGTRRQLI